MHVFLVFLVFYKYITNGSYSPICVVFGSVIAHVSDYDWLVYKELFIIIIIVIIICLP